MFDYDTKYDQFCNNSEQQAENNDSLSKYVTTNTSSMTYGGPTPLEPSYDTSYEQICNNKNLINIIRRSSLCDAMIGTGWKWLEGEHFPEGVSTMILEPTM
eukprot:6470159-Amphidinium_carterae.1